MNDSDWLRKHLRGKAQRAAAQTPTTGVRAKVRALIRSVAELLSRDQKEESQS